MFKLMRNRNRKGFSLMELVLVVAIMTILAGILTPMVFASRRAAQDAKAMAEMDAIATACRAYYSDENTMEGITMAGLASGGYLSENAPVDPWGNPYGVVSFGTWGTDGRPTATVCVGVFSTTNPANVTAAALDDPADADEFKEYGGLTLTVVDLVPAP